MGVRGLTTFMAKNEELMEKYKLHDTFVIIDGNSLSCQLFTKYANSECFAFGGDYDRFAQHVKDFFLMFSKCNVKSVVVFDGGCEEKKLETILKRAKEKTVQLENILPASSLPSAVFPYLMRRVFREVLLEIGVPMVQCDFEADQEIAALGIKYNCPILSYDSDFFISGAKYIPIPTIEHEARTSVSNQFFIYCEIFRVENLLKRYRGLEMSMLPLLSALAGNDYVETHQFEKFYSQLGIGQRFPAHMRVDSVLHWLRRVGDFDSARRKILRTIGANDQSFVSKKIEETIESCNCKNLTVESYLPSIIIGHSSKPDLCNLGTNQVQGNVQTISQVESAIKFPDWLLNSCRKGLINSSVIEIFTLKTCISNPQVEDFSLTPCHEVSIPLIMALIRIIHGEGKVTVDYWGRLNKTSFGKYRLQSSNIAYPNLENSLELSIENKTSMFLKLLNVPADFCVDIFPDEWKLYLCTIIYWMKKTTVPLITDAHVMSLVLCMIALNIIDGKLGFVREVSQFLKSYRNKWPSISPLTSHRDLKDLLLQIDENDCILCFDSFLKFQHLNQNLISNPALFSRSIIHAFAQLQSCLHYSMIINSIMNFPFKQCVVHKLFSGTFIYNVYSEIISHKNAEEVPKKLLCKSPKLFKVYRTLVSAICRPTPTIASSTATHHKRSKKEER
ncbi:protein asteroid-like [Nilaparvata lugens]|uniref:protein asteroid-like n=1 Tax=Nilaparvata lugens TaxID=108931 RepID=UPI00193E4862|nr:protein asteroid-like [Nilaparvata lugens]